MAGRLGVPRSTIYAVLRRRAAQTFATLGYPTNSPDRTGPRPTASRTRTLSPRWKGADTHFTGP